MNDAVRLALERPQPLYRQLFSHFEAAIANGDLLPGDRIPPTLALAERFQVAVSTVQEALDQLRRRGLVDRVPGRGTVVSRVARARTWGVVFGEPVLASPDRRIYPLVTVHLQRLLAPRGIRLRLYHPDLDGGLAGAWQDIERDAAEGRLRLLLPLCPGPDLVRRLGDACPLPATGGAPWRGDDRAFAALGAGHLLARGRRRIALLGSGGSQGQELLAGMRAAHAAAGLAWDERLLAGPANTEAGGLAAAQAVLAAPDLRPDAWLVADDNACRGVLTGLLWAGCAIPAAMAVVSHGNRGLPPAFPLPVTRLEYDPADMAAAVLAAADAVLAGRAAETAVIAPALVPGGT